MRPDGIANLSWAEYREEPREHWSTLKEILDTPARYKWAKHNPGEDTDDRAFGRAVHLGVLEPERFSKEVIGYDDRRAGKEWDAFKLAHGSCEILTARAYKRATQVVEAVLSDSTARKYLEGAKEASLLWTSARGKKLKGRLDCLGSNFISDVKTTTDAGPVAFPKQAIKLGYHGQAAFYRMAAKQLLGEWLPFYCIAVESEAPHLVAVYRMPDGLLDEGQAMALKALDTLEDCETFNRWPGYSAGGEMEMVG